jgi:hypothetical protein
MAIVHVPASYRVKRLHKKAATDSAADRAKALRTTKRILRQVTNVNSPNAILVRCLTRRFLNVRLFPGLQLSLVPLKGNHPTGDHFDQAQGVLLRFIFQVSAGGDGNFGGRNLRAGQKREPPP